MDINFWKIRIPISQQFEYFFQVISTRTMDIIVDKALGNRLESDKNYEAINMKWTCKHLY